MTPQKVNSFLVILAALFVAVMFGVMQASSAVGGLAWENNLTQATAAAKQARKPMLVCFHTPNCVYCAKMDATTFRDAKVLALAQRFVCVRVDSAIDPKATDAARISEFPTTVFLNAQGREAFRVAGYIAPDRFAALMQTVSSAN